MTISVDIQKRKDAFLSDVENLAKDTGKFAEVYADKVKREYGKLEDLAKENLDKVPWKNKVIWVAIGVSFVVGVVLGNLPHLG